MVFASNWLERSLSPPFTPLPSHPSPSPNTMNEPAVVLFALLNPSPLPCYLFALCSRGSWIRLLQFVCALASVAGLGVMGVVDIAENKVGVQAKFSTDLTPPPSSPPASHAVVP